MKKEKKNESSRLNINSMRYKYKQCEIRCFDYDNSEEIAHFLSNGMLKENLKKNLQMVTLAFLFPGGDKYFSRFDKKNHVLDAF